MTIAAAGNGRATLDFGDPVTEVFAFLHSVYGRKLPVMTFIYSRKRVPDPETGKLKMRPEFYARAKPTTKLIRDLLELGEKPGHEIFFRVAPMGKDGLKTTEADVLPCNVYWTEVDSHGLTDDNLALLDRIGATIVNSGGIADDDGDKTHVYGRFLGEAPTHPAAVNKVLNLALRNKLDGDKVQDLTRMLRLPGTYHRKADPVLCTLRTRSRRRALRAPDVASVLGTGVSDTSVRKSTQRASVESVEPPGKRDQWAWKELRTADSRAQEPAADRSAVLWGLYCELVKVGVLEGGHILWYAQQSKHLGERASGKDVARFLAHKDYERAVAEWESTRKPDAPEVRAGAATQPAVSALTSNTPRPKKRDTPSEAEFWDSRKELTHIKEFAHSRLVAPWAMFGVVIARVMNRIPPTVLLPPLVGGTVGLNFFVGVVGLSGDGKGAAERAAREGMDVGDVAAVNIGSGEGIPKAFMKRRKADPGEIPPNPGDKTILEMYRESVLLSVPEIDTFAAIKGRSSSTISGELRKAWSGEALGFLYADETKRMPMEENTYRMTLVAGVQPRRAQTLLEDMTGGLPQRFFWVPATDPNIPDLDKIEDVEPMKLVLPDYFHEESKPGQPQTILTVCESARRIIRETRHAKVKGDVPTNPMDSHRNLVRLKLAVAIAHLAGRKEMTDEDWELSDVAMSVSDGMRAFMQEEIARAAAEESRDRGRQDGIREVHKKGTVEKENARMGYLQERLEKVLGEAEKPMSLSDLQKAVPRVDWDAVPDVLDKMIADGDAVEVGKNRRQKPLYESAE